MLSRFNLVIKESKRDDLLKAGTYHEAKVRLEERKLVHESQHFCQ